MKKMLSLILLGSLVINTGAQAKPNHLANKIFSTTAALMLGGVGYCLYSAYKNQPTATGAENSVRIFNTILKQLDHTNGYKQINGLRQQIDETTISADAKTTLKDEIGRYDDSITANQLQQTQMYAQHVKTLLTTHIDAARKIAISQDGYYVGSIMLGLLTTYPLFGLIANND